MRYSRHRWSSRTECAAPSVRLPPFHVVQTPLIGNALQGVSSAILESNPGPGHQVLHGAGNQHFVLARHSCHAGGDVNSDAADILPHQLALAAVETGADTDAKGPGTVADGAGAADCPGRAVEGGQETVACGLHLAAAKAGDLFACQGV